MADLVDKNKKFFNCIAKYYDCKILKNWLIRIQKRTLKFVNPRKNSSILDVGCGTGSLLDLFDDKFKLYGTDISIEMLKIARKKLGKKAKFKLISVEKLDYKNKFDYIFSTEAFHHFTDHNTAMRNFYNALKNNGTLVIVDLNFGKFFNWIFHIIEPGNTKMFSKKEFYRLFKDNNFKNISQKKVGLAIITTGNK